MEELTSFQLLLLERIETALALLVASAALSLMLLAIVAVHAMRSSR